MNLLEQMTYNSSAGPFYEEDDLSALAVVNPLVRLIAFYLPQFHSILENDVWWGKGFTEWTNVTKAVPRFDGHYQPRLPGELGFYDLTRSETLRRQAALGSRYGIAGFCFHHYWFGGHRLLEQPLELLLSNPDIEMPFCINWANENWTRRWDGHDKSILMGQEHSADDDIAFARSLEPFFRDRRYIRVDGRPLLMLYRPGILPDAALTVSRWREHFKTVGLGDPYIVMAQAFDDGDFLKYGMDGAVGFPPFWTGGSQIQDLELFDPKYSGEVVSYKSMAARTTATYLQSTRVFPGVCPSWDNEARKPGKGFCFNGSTPALYGKWLGAACQAAIRVFPSDERLVFINAWNEWAEGAYLEPDRHFGYAYLAQTARVLSGLSLVSPDQNDPTKPDSDLLQSMVVPRPSMRRRARRAVRVLLNKAATLADDIAWKLRSL